jgi:hypothetical protein
MIKYDERFFTLREARFDKKEQKLLLTFLGYDNFEPEIPKNESHCLRQINAMLDDEKIEIDFEYFTIPDEYIDEKGANAEAALKQVEAWHEQLAAVEITQVDRTLPMKSHEYLLGLPIKTRPIKIRFLRSTPDLQVTGGHISFLKKREYTRGEVKKQYYTFLLDDGEGRMGCVYFPTAKDGGKFEKLGDRSAVCVIGVNERRDERSNFRVVGIAFADF